MRYTLFEEVMSVEGAARRDAAIEAVRNAASKDWRAAAHGVVKFLASTQDEFTTDDVWLYMDRFGKSPPREPRAMGAVIDEARKSGIIESAGRYIESIRPVCHRRPVKVWRRKRDA